MSTKKKVDFIWVQDGEQGTQIELEVEVPESPINVLKEYHASFSDDTVDEETFDYDEYQGPDGWKVAYVSDQGRGSGGVMFWRTQD